MTTKIKPRRIIDYLHRGKVKRFAVNVEIEDGYIRLEYTDVNVNRVNDLEWVRYDENKLIKEYYPNDIEYKTIIKIWWRFARKYITAIKQGESLGTSHVQKMYNDSVKETKD